MKAPVAIEHATQVWIGDMLHAESDEGCTAAIVNNVNCETDEICLTIFPKHGPQLEATRRVTVPTDKLHFPVTGCDVRVQE